MSKHHAPRAAQRKKGKPKLDKPRLLSAGSGYVQDPRYALGATSQHPTPPDDLLETDEGQDVREPEPEAVDEETQRWITEQSGNRFAILKAEEERRREVRSLAAQVREVGTLALQRNMDLPELDRIKAELESARKRLKAAA